MDFDASDLLYGNQPKGGKRKRFSRTVEKTIYTKFKGKCAICERKIEFDDGDIDHIKSLAKGGTDNPSNLQWLCHRCNVLKGSTKTNAQVRKLLGLTDKPSKPKPKSTKPKSKPKKPKKDVYEKLLWG